MANPTLPSPFRMLRAAMRYATNILKVAPPPKTLPMYASRESREKPVLCLRALWIIFLFSPSGKRLIQVLLVLTGRQDYIILNSVSNLPKALYPLGNYERIHCLLDNDDAGRKAVEVIQSEYGLRVRDSSHLYSGHKDLNDYLCGKRLVQSVDLTQPSKQTQSANNPKKQEQQPPKKKSRGFRM